ncbi:calcium-binding protein [Cyanobium gracile UHCC 0139]|uniref:Calcium-binding protein n=1 Tax=Cyanobium gracile UHCC 0139 TaxID=3110308 RepID=A0ABU5RS61_9CYAN|nr:calcium-binding protein [Cyanobium gracile]MEA5390616.1 calcium-binding protein [Cyanobium gracile UHCC 0139]
MAFQPITTALSRALALRLGPGTTFLGGGLQLTIAPGAQASNRVVLPAGQPVGSLASALGLGLGSSRFLADPEDAAFFGSPGLSIITGGGSIVGTAAATATTTGRNANAADAKATNIGLANLDVITRGGDPLWIGSPGNPLQATASAATRSLLPSGGQPLLTARLSALATVRGLEGAPSTDRLAGGALPSFFGQPNAAVLASATLDADPGPTTTASRAVADARGIEGYRVMALPAALPGSPAEVSGLAVATLRLEGAPPTSVEPADLTATAIGIDHAILRGPASGPLNVQGSGLAQFDAAVAPPPGSLRLNNLQGTGLLAVDLQSNGGDTTVVGLGGFAAPTGGGLLPAMDAAGIDGSTILTGTGNDTVFGGILTEQTAGVDADGDGVLSADVFLDASALIGGPGGFDGIRNSLINTGLGEDVVVGAASRSRIDTAGGDDAILLDRARASFLDGGFGDDAIAVLGLALDNSLRGGFGNDTVTVAAGDGNRLDGGFGQDLVAGGTGKNTFLQSNAGAALDAVSRSVAPDFAERLTDPAFWAALETTAKEDLWGERAQQSGTKVMLDTISNFDAARGDVLELSSTLGSITQSLWQSQGAIFGVQDGQLVVRDGPQTSQIGLVVGSLADIRSLGIGSPSLAYATDTRQLMYDADGDWSKGSRSLGTVTMADPAALTKSSIQFGSGG